MRKHTTSPRSQIRNICNDVLLRAEIPNLCSTALLPPGAPSLQGLGAAEGGF